MYNVHLTQTTGAFINYNERLPCQKEESEIFVGDRNFMCRGDESEKYFRLQYVRSVCTSGRRVRAPYFFFFRFYANPQVRRVEGRTKSANSRHEIATRTGRGSFVTKVPFFYLLIQKNRERGRWTENESDATPAGCNPRRCWYFFFFFPAGCNDARIVTRRITQMRVLTRRRQYRWIAIIFTSGSLVK